MKKIILASGSPRRKQLLEQIGLDFEVAVSNVDEAFNPDLKPNQQPGYLSKKKAQAVAAKFPSSIIIAADTLVVVGNEVMGKPKDKMDAKRILKKLSGKMHLGITGFTIIDTSSGRSITKSIETKIWFRKLTENEIVSFVEREKPYDKAGAYAIHELASIFVEKIEGDFFNVVGLSVYELANELKKFGVKII